MILANEKYFSKQERTTIIKNIKFAFCNDLIFSEKINLEKLVFVECPVFEKDYAVVYYTAGEDVAFFYEFTPKKLTKEQSFRKVYFQYGTTNNSGDVFYFDTLDEAITHSKTLVN